MTDEGESTDPGMIGAERAILKFLRVREANRALRPHLPYECPRSGVKWLAGRKSDAILWEKPPCQQLNEGEQ
jgi:hypothetical protein